jgi:hypothetical protein
VYLAPELTDVGVLSLTALTRLQSLFIYKCGISEELSEPGEEGILELSNWQVRVQTCGGFVRCFLLL